MTLPPPRSIIIFLACYASGCVASASPVEPDAMARVENDDGTWSMALAPEDVPTEPMVRGAMTFEYVGQAHFDLVPKKAVPGPYTIGGKSTKTPLEEMIGTIIIDDLGRRWEATSVDREIACEYAMAAAELDKVDGVDGAGDVEDPCARLDEIPVPTEIETGWWTPQSWNYETCNPPFGNSSPTAVESVWDEEDRTSVGSTFTYRQRVSVAIYRAPNGAWSQTEHDFHCTGTVIDEHHVLTAAHCVGIDAIEPSGNFRVCTRGNLHHNATQSVCSPVANIKVHPNWLTSGASRWDIAVLDVGADLASHVGFMTMSNILPTTPRTLHNNAFPLVTPGCATSNVTVNGSTETITNGVGLYTQTGELLSANFNNIKTRMDGGPGHSGSGIYGCAGGTCEGDEVPRLYGVWSGHYKPVGFPWWTGGASVPGQFEWINENL